MKCTMSGLTRRSVFWARFRCTAQHCIMGMLSANGLHKNGCPFHLYNQEIMPEDYSTLSHFSPLVTNERLSKALTDWFKEEYTFTHWAYVGDMNKGDSFVSEVIRIQIYGVNTKGHTNFVQVILKSIPKNVFRRSICRSHDFFRNEINFYKNILPELIAFQSKKKLKNPFDRYVKLFFAYADGNNDVVCLEDGSVYNFGNAIRQEGIDLEHCKMTFRAFAEFHALSFAMKDQEPKNFKELQETITEVYYDEPHKNWYINFWNRISEVAINAVEKEYPDSIYLEKIKKFAVPERYEDMINAATKTSENGVICHGDSWGANFLYRYEDGHPIDAKMVDFQMLRFGTPVLDLSVMIYTCTDQELRDKNYDELLHFYHDTLSSQIEDLGSDPQKIYPWPVFMEEIKKYSYFGLGYSFDTTPFTVLAPEDAVDLELEGEEGKDIVDVWKVPDFKTKEGRLREANNVKHCVGRGYI
ncbi:unnamed protein product [Arctia plantaginis]|uniref:CHK kinase-like domain-containing protein n=1 Tax=Arctia plantaginis TaxID=874455 RepID=A0A8S0Z786_ARCPL|nr:unnamed protein product [Arctia plantaginis]